MSQEITLVRADIAGNGNVPIADGAGGYTWGPQTGGTGFTGWAASTAYAQGQQVSYMGQLYARLTAGTSASTWAADSSNWLLLGQLPSETDGLGRTQVLSSSSIPAPALRALVSASDEPWGATADCITVTDAAITTGQYTLSSTQAAFTSANVGQHVTVQGAGTQGTNNNQPLAAQIVSVTSGVATLNTAATTTVSGATAWFGTLNTTAFQGVHTAVSSAGGGTILMPAAYNGRAYLTSTIAPSSNVTVWGHGVTLQKHGDSTDGIYSNKATFTAFSNFSVFGVNFVGEGQSAGNVSGSTTERRGAIGVYNCTNARVRDCTATGFAYQGFAFINVVGVKVLDSTLTNVSYAGLGNAIHITTTAAPSSPQDAVVTGNTVTGCQTAPCCIQSQFANSSNVPYQARVHHNNFTTNAFACISLEILGAPTTGQTIRQVVIDHNHCNQTGAAGTGSYGIAVSDNSGGTYSSDPLEFDFIVIDHNPITSSDNGIICEASNCTIDSNPISAATIGIAAEGNSTNTPSQVMVVNNILSMAINSGYGILSACSNTTIDNNRIAWPTGSTTGTGCGIDSQGATPTVTRNVIEYAPLHGIQFAANSPDTLCEGNRIYNPNEIGNAGGAGINWLATTLGTRNNVRFNTIIDNRGTVKMVYCFNNGGSGNGHLYVDDNTFWTTTGGTFFNGTAPISLQRNSTPLGTAFPTGITQPTVGASPYTYSNASGIGPMSCFISGGTGVSVAYVRGSSGSQPTGVSAGMVRLEWQDSIIITYSTAPTLTVIPAKS